MSEYWTDGNHRFWYGVDYDACQPVGQIARNQDGALCFVVLDKDGRMTGNILAIFESYPDVFQLATLWERHL